MYGEPRDQQARNRDGHDQVVRRVLRRRKGALGVLGALALITLFGCEHIFALEIGDCIFAVTREHPAVITWDDMVRCTDLGLTPELYAVEFPDAEK